MARRETDSPNWGGAGRGQGPKRQYIRIPVNGILMETFIGEGTKIEVFFLSENLLMYHIEGQGITTVDELYRGSVADLLAMLLTPIGCTISNHRIIQASLL